MAIKEYVSPYARRYVACIGALPLPSDISWFESLEFKLPQNPDIDLGQDEFLSGCAAVIFSQNPAKPLNITRDLERYSVKLLNFGCQIIIRVPPAGRKIVVNKIDELRLPASGLDKNEKDGLGSWWLRGFEGEPQIPHVRLYSEDDWQEILRLVVSHPAEKPPNKSLHIKAVSEQGQILSLEEEDLILLQRAFGDCQKVHLTRFSDGLSGDNVYRAYAERAEIKAGSKPISSMYFVKLGARISIAKESDIYTTSVRSYIPFHLGPDLIHERCFLGAYRGLIVGDYVQESESLRACASASRAASALACLFDRTLQGWYRDAETRNEPIVEYLFKFAKNVKAIPDARRQEAMKLGGVRLDLPELLTLFEKNCNSTPVLVGRIHGDLHPGNVLVRGADAILIDFLKHEEHMPLVYDAATLEAGLLVDGFNEQNGPEWIESVLPLYDAQPFQAAKLYTDPLNSSHWFYESVRQIRTYAFHMERAAGQYAAALVIALIKKGCKDLPFSKPEASRRAGALVIAERILLNREAQSKMNQKNITER